MDNINQVAKILHVSLEVAEKAMEYGLLKLASNPEKGLEILGIDSHAILWQALNIVEIGLEQQVFRSEGLTSPEKAEKELIKLLKLKYQNLEHEVFGLVWLDNQHRPLDVEILFRGTIDSCSVYPREVVKSALKSNAAAVIIFHNHPSGIATPSESDKLITSKLQKALDVIEVRVLDHLILADSTVSFSQLGLL